MTSISSPSSETMWTRTEDCFCHEHVRQRPAPNVSCAQRRTSSAESASTSASVSESGVVMKQDLVERVGAEADAERLERDHLVRRNVAEVDVGPEPAHEPRLGGLGRRLEDDVLDVDLVDHLVDQACSHVAA